jgi:hypothetical protein
MRHIATLLPALLLACAPADAVLGGLDADEEALGGGTGGDAGGGPVEGAPGGGDGGGAGGSGDVDPEPSVTLQSGDWVAVGVGTEDDPCEWNGILESYFGIDVASFLPSDFVVEARDGGFRIEAQDYGAQGPIDCEVAGGSFECETQRVSPTTYDLGEYGWAYRIDFFGTVVDEDTLQGEAIVSYPSIDEGTAQTLDYYGIDPSDCTQTYSLAIELAD